MPLGAVATQFTAAANESADADAAQAADADAAAGLPIFEQVPGGLAWYKPLVTTMQANVNDYASVNSLPIFNLFTWFFVIPGILLDARSPASGSGTSPSDRHKRIRRRPEDRGGRAGVGDSLRARPLAYAPDDPSAPTARRARRADRRAVPAARRADSDQAARPAAYRRGERAGARRSARHDATEHLEAPRRARAQRRRRAAQGRATSSSTASSTTASGSSATTSAAASSAASSELQDLLAS